MFVPGIRLIIIDWGLETCEEWWNVIICASNKSISNSKGRFWQTCSFAKALQVLSIDDNERSAVNLKNTRIIGESRLLIMELSYN